MYKADFPFFSHNPDIIYLDSAGTTQKPRVVLERITQFLSEDNAPIGRSLYAKGIQATEQLEAVRASTYAFLGAHDGHIVFTYGATDSLNLLAHGITLKSGDEIIIAESEHHANIVPWQQAAAKCGARLLFVKTTEYGEVNLEHLGEIVTENTRIVSLSLVSNVYGTILETHLVKEIIERQGRDTVFILDASQAIAHFPLSVALLGSDAIVFSSHKMYGPSGVGILWGTTSLLESLTPYRTGGGMISRVTLSETSFDTLPSRLEAGTPNTEGIIGFGAALEYLNRISMEAVRDHTSHLVKLCIQQITESEGFTVLGNPNPASGIVSFTHSSIHPHDIAEFLASHSICVRAGHQCAQPLHAAKNISGSIRVSVGLYTTEDDITKLSAALRQASQFFLHA